MELLRPGPDRLNFHALPAQVGQLTLPAGTVLPETRHAEDEISFIHSGRMRAVCGGRDHLLQAGDVTLIPAGEAHSAEVLEEVRLSYVLLEPRPPAPASSEPG